MKAKSFILTVAALTWSAAAMAQANSGNTRMESLSPDLQQQVQPRMGRGQNVAELVETTLLNQLVLQYPEIQQIDTSTTPYRATVRDRSGTTQTVMIDPATGSITPQGGAATGTGSTATMPMQGGNGAMGTSTVPGTAGSGAATGTGNIPVTTPPATGMQGQ